MIEKLPLLFWPRNILTIFIFHRVLKERDPLRPGEPDQADFERLIAFIAKNFRTLPLLEAAELLTRERLPPKTVSITFDDGYADNYTYALPIIEKYGLTATIFVASAYLDGGRMFNDDVIDAIAAAQVDDLDLTPIGLGCHSLRDLPAKKTAIQAILAQLKYRLPEERTEAAEYIRAASRCAPLPRNIMLTSEQVAEMSRRGVEIGGHTADHPILARLDDASALRQISSDKERLEMITDKRIESFAYPNGKPGRDYLPKHVEMVRAAGFRQAVSTAYGIARPSSDRLQLPRFTPWRPSIFGKSLQLRLNAHQLIR